jgi:mRNA interferase RelE/StbE
MDAPYTIRVRASAERELRSLPKKDNRRVTKRLQALASDPRPHGVVKLAGEEGYRVRQGDYRILYTIDDLSRVVEVTRIRHRREVYRS